MDDLLNATAHRPYPLPDKPWMMTQTWENLLFMHWPVDGELVRAHLPEELKQDLDTREGSAWITISPFQVRHQRFRALPEIPLLNAYLELNVRTYVRRNGRGGVYFFSLDANHPPAVFAANGLLALPYKNAEMSFEEDSQGRGFLFKSKRITGEDESGNYAVTYKPVSEPSLCGPGTLEHWLVERYCLFTTRDGKVIRGDIHHLPWDLSRAEASASENKMSPVALPGGPILQYCESKKVLMFPFEED